MKKALVTGGAGFIGSHLCEKLLARGLHVSAIDNFSTGCKSNIMAILKDKKNDNKFVFHKGSVMNKKKMEGLIKKCDVIYHLAAAVGVKYILDHPVDSILTNIRGAEIVLGLASKYRKRIVIASSSEVYGKGANYPLKENDDKILGMPKIGRWSYSYTKAVSEALACAYCKENGLSVVIVRLFNTVGPRQVGDFGMVLPRFIESAISNKRIEVYGEGEQVRSFIHVQDVVKMIVDLSFKQKIKGEFFNIGNSQSLSIKNLAFKIKHKTNSKSRIIYIPLKKVYCGDFEDVLCRIPDISKLKKTINYNPKYTIDDIIDSTIEYIKIKKNSNI